MEEKEKIRNTDFVATILGRLKRYDEYKKHYKTDELGEYVQIENVTVIGNWLNIHLNSTDIVGRVKLVNCVLPNVSISHATLSHLELINCTSGNWNIISSEIKELLIAESTIELVLIEATTIKLNINKSTFKDISISNNSKNVVLKINKFSCPRVYIGKSGIEKLDIEDSNLEYFSIANSNAEVISLTKTKIKNVHIQDSKTIKQINWSGAFGSININKCIIGVSHFTNSEIHRFEFAENEIEKTQLSHCNTPDIIISNCRMNYFIVDDTSYTGDINVLSKSDIKRIQLSKSTSGTIFIEESKTEELLLESYAATDIAIIRVEQISIKIDTTTINGDVECEAAQVLDTLISNSTVSNIIYEKCTQKIFEHRSSKSKNVFQKKCQLDTLIINGGKIDFLDFTNSSTQSFIVKKSTVANINLEQSKAINKCELTDSFVREFNIENSQTGNINLRNNRINDFSINENSNIGDIVCEGSIIANIDFENVTTGDLTLSKLVCGELYIHRTTVEDITIMNNSHIAELEMEYLNADSKTLLLSNSIIEKFHVIQDKPYKISSEISTIFEIDFFDIVFSKDSYLHLSDTVINKLNIDSFLNLGVIVLNNISSVNKINQIKKTKRENQEIYTLSDNWHFEYDNFQRISQFSLVNSDLGKTQFIGCKINSFQKFVFKNSKLLDVFVADTLMPKRDKISIEEDDSSHTLLLEQRRIALSQFKKIYETRGDTVRSMEYLAEEMEVYREQLKHQKTTNNKEWWNNKSERFNLWLNRFSSYYGNNWLRAASLTLVINAVLFWLYCWRLGFGIAVPNDKSWAMFKKLFSYSFEFLNPLRKADFLQSVAEPTNSARVVDYISRIIIAYFVYQTIAAFRKFGKKST